MDESAHFLLSASVCFLGIFFFSMTNIVLGNFCFGLLVSLGQPHMRLFAMIPSGSYFQR